jgi:CheY-like chemotaxis protein
LLTIGCHELLRGNKLTGSSAGLAASGKGKDMRVLLVEDDSATAQSIELMLKSESFNVYTTDLGEEGVDLGKLYDYDIILLDLNLPDMSGYEVLRSLRLAKIKTPILILSGMAGIEDKVRGLERPCTICDQLWRAYC